MRCSPAILAVAGISLALARLDRRAYAVTGTGLSAPACGNATTVTIQPISTLFETISIPVETSITFLTTVEITSTTAVTSTSFVTSQFTSTAIVFQTITIEISSTEIVTSTLVTGGNAATTTLVTGNTATIQTSASSTPGSAVGPPSFLSGTVFPIFGSTAGAVSANSAGSPSDTLFLTIQSTSYSTVFLTAAETLSSLQGTGAFSPPMLSSTQAIVETLSLVSITGAISPPMLSSTQTIVETLSLVSNTGATSPSTAPASAQVATAASTVASSGVSLITLTSTLISEVTAIYTGFITTTLSSDFVETIPVSTVESVSAITQAIVSVSTQIWTETNNITSVITQPTSSIIDAGLTSSPSQIVTAITWGTTFAHGSLATQASTLSASAPFGAPNTAGTVISYLTSFETLTYTSKLPVVNTTALGYLNATLVTVSINGGSFSGFGVVATQLSGISTSTRSIYVASLVPSGLSDPYGMISSRWTSTEMLTMSAPTNLPLLGRRSGTTSPCSIGSVGTRLSSSTVSLPLYANITGVPVRTGSSPGLSKSTASGVPASCTGAFGTGQFVLDFDSLPDYATNNNKSLLFPPIPQYDNFLFSEGYTYGPPPDVRFKPQSPPHLALFSPSLFVLETNGGPYPGLIDTGINADNPVWWFDVHSVYVGCSTTLVAPDVCLFNITGYALIDNVKTSIPVLEFAVLPCLNNEFESCTLTELTMTLTGLMGLQIEAYSFVGDPIQFFMDSLNLGWSDNSAAAAFAHCNNEA